MTEQRHRGSLSAIKELGQDALHASEHVVAEAVAEAQHLAERAHEEVDAALGIPDDEQRRQLREKKKKKQEMMVQRKGLRDDARKEGEWVGEANSTSGLHLRANLRSLIDSTVVQVSTMLIIFLDFGLTVASIISPEDQFLNDAGLVVICLLICDIIARLFAYGCDFFRSFLNIFEATVMLLCLAFMALEAWLDANMNAKDISLGRIVRQILRGAKGARLASKALAGKQALTSRFDKVIDSISDNLVHKYLGDIFHLPDNNVTFKASQGLFHIVKAQLISEAFSGIHSFLGIKGGLMEFIHFNLNLAEKREHQDFEVNVENILLVIGPRGKPPPPVGPEWDFWEVSEAKGKLVELISRRAEGLAQKPKPTAAEAKKRDGMAAKFAKGMVNTVREAMFSRLRLVVRNIEVRFEDPHCRLCHTPVCAAFRIGSVVVETNIWEKSVHVDDPPYGEWEMEDSPQETRIEIQRDSSRTSRLSLFASHSMPGTKRHSHAEDIVKVEIRCERVSAYVDQVKDESLLYTAAFDSNVGMREVAHMLHRSFAREAIFWASVRALEDRWKPPKEEDEYDSHHRVWEWKQPVRNALGRHKARKEFRRRLAPHNYMLWPTGLYAEARVRRNGLGIASLSKEDDGKKESKRSSVSSIDSLPASSSSAGSEASNRSGSRGELHGSEAEREEWWQPAVDLDVEFFDIDVKVDATQASLARQMLRHSRNFRDANEKMQWRPVPRHIVTSARSPNGAISSVVTKSLSKEDIEMGADNSADLQRHARMNWIYALWLVLKSLDPNCKWHVLFVLNMRRCAEYRPEYVDLMVAKYEAVREAQRQKNDWLRLRQSARSSWSSDMEMQVNHIQVIMPLKHIIHYRLQAKKIDLEKQVETNKEASKAKYFGSKAEEEDTESSSDDDKADHSSQLPPPGSLDNDSESSNEGEGRHRKPKKDLLEKTGTPRTMSLQIKVSARLFRAILLASPDQKDGVETTPEIFRSSSCLSQRRSSGSSQASRVSSCPTSSMNTYSFAEKSIRAGPVPPTGHLSQIIRVEMRSVMVKILDRKSVV